MQEITVKNNALKLKVFIDDFPDISLMPSSDLDLLISDLELEIANKVKKKKACKQKQSATKKMRVPP